MTMQEATYLLLKKLRIVYSEGETSNITDWVMEHLTGSKKAERMIYKNETLNAGEENQLLQYIERLMAHEPVQYVLNEAWFCGLKLYVDKSVLIPRPETEELVEWVIDGCRFPIDKLSILDIGSGSGCIAIALKRRLGKAEVWSCDISTEALRVAKKNAATLGVDVNFIELDFLDVEQRTTLPYFDIIVSNPPYIATQESKDMRPNVLDYEPSTALFVPDDDPLVFYRAIADFGRIHLKKNGSIFAELNEGLSKQTADIFNAQDYHAEIKLDMQQKDRMIKAMIKSDHGVAF
ncbi:MAG TPA: peptide chain release factor N(5)-glutamine methyltransferase [Chitinophagaceae bacterium]|nr:peptide chain release factor N(5)-glutamine methyltransferase [Chitinophagaceae bacterium]